MNKILLIYAYLPEHRETTGKYDVDESGLLQPAMKLITGEGWYLVGRIKQGDEKSFTLIKNNFSHCALKIKIIESKTSPSVFTPAPPLRKYGSWSTMQNLTSLTTEEVRKAVEQFKEQVNSKVDSSILPLKDGLDFDEDDGHFGCNCPMCQDEQDCGGSK